MGDRHPLVGSCFGYQVRSPLLLSYLRAGGFGEPLEIVERHDVHQPEGEPLFRWERTPERDFEGSLYAEDDGYRFWSDREGWFHIDPSAPSITVPVGVDPFLRERRLWGVPVVLCFLRRGDLSLHAAAVEVEGSAFLFAAPGRFGKTTLAGAFLRAGFRVLAEDISCCRTASEPIVFPGPALLRVRQDSYGNLQLRGTRRVAEEADRVHLAIDESRRGDGTPVPISGVIFLRKGDEGISMERVTTERVLPDLWALAWRLPVEEDAIRCFDGTVALAGRVPAWNLYRSLTFGALEDVVETIVTTCRPL